MARSRNDSGRPWPSYGNLPCSNSTVFCVLSFMMKVTFGISGMSFANFARPLRWRGLQIGVSGLLPPVAPAVANSPLDVLYVLACQGFAHAAVHGDLRQMP